MTQCSAGNYCINGVSAACPAGTWSLAGYTGCNYCPPNHICNQTPTSCANGQYMNTLTATSCSTCSAGYFCKKDWIERIKIYPGTYAGSGSTSATECPSAYSCTASAASLCGNYLYSGPGGLNCEAMPEFLQRSGGTGTRSESGTTIIAKGYRQTTGNDGSPTSCGTTFYCPGIDGGYSTPYEGYTVSTASFTAKPPGTGCTGTDYSNGGTACNTCSPGVSDRSQCRDETNGAINTEFAESYYNENDEREGVVITCLDSSAVRTAYPGSITGTVKYESGNYGETCGAEASLVSGNIYDPTECDGQRDTDKATKLGAPKNKYTLSHYRMCSWCPDDLICEYTNSFFSFFRGFLLECPHGEYSPNGDLNCHRKDTDTFCKTGYYRTVHSSDRNDQWIHDQDKRYECIPINQSPSTNYEALDSTYTPNCEVGDWVRYGIEGCQANSPGFYNDANSYTEATTKCTDGYFCAPDRIKDELKTSQFSCPKGSTGMTSGAKSELEQCDLCREGNYCVEGTSLSTQQSCLQGYFCPPGTSEKLQNTCGAGFYGAGTGGKHFSDTCTMCASGNYCEQSSSSGTTCPLGYFCFEYTDEKNKYPAMPGQYIGAATGSLSGATTCPIGKYCPLGSTAPLDCPTGTVTASTGMGELLNCGS